MENIKKQLTEEHKRKLSESLKGRKRSKEICEKISKGRKGIKFSKEHIENMSSAQKGKISLKRGTKLNDEEKKLISEKTKLALNNEIVRNKMSVAKIGKTRNKHSDITKQKMRISAIRNIEKYRSNISPNIGKNETRLLNEIEQKENIKIERQYHIKDLGYIVDGYDKNNNVVYEVYEKLHTKPIKIGQDLQRQKEIEDFLKCKFIIINDNENI